jgi:DNA-binding transcriptional MocR family regulator
MLGAMERHFPSTARWNSPCGGMFIFVAWTGRSGIVITR